MSELAVMQGVGRGICCRVPPNTAQRTCRLHSAPPAALQLLRPHCQRRPEWQHQKQHVMRGVPDCCIASN